MAVLAMSQGELSRYDTLLCFERGELRIEDASALLGIGARQIYRLLGRLRDSGPEALVSWKRGRPSNRAFGPAFRASVLDLMREHYHDFGPTLAAEYLAERHGKPVVSPVSPILKGACERHSTRNRQAGTSQSSA